MGPQRGVEAWLPKTVEHGSMRSQNCVALVARALANAIQDDQDDRSLGALEALTLV